MGGLDNSHALFDNVHNDSISECTDTIDNGYVKLETDPKLIDIDIDPLTPPNDTPATSDQTISSDLIGLFDNTTPKELDNEIDTNMTNQDWYTEIVHLGTKDDCSIMIKIGERNYKTLWDSGAGKCVISYDKFLTISEKLKSPLVPSNILINAANGSLIQNKGECDITFKIGPQRFTFTFLVSNELTQDII